MLSHISEKYMYEKYMYVQTRLKTLYTSAVPAPVFCPRGMAITISWPIAQR